MNKRMERLQKVIAHAGVASRRKSEELIEAGRVKVNGKTVTALGTKVAVDDVIEVDGVPLDKEPLVYYLFYKPRGVISAASDNKGRKVVTDFFPEVDERIYPVGRLDYDASGLILLTNDGAFAQALAHPSKKIDKVYVAKVKGLPTREKLAPLKKGIYLDGRKTAPAKISILSADRQKENGIVQLTIHEGRNHQVKNMLKAVGYPVEKLKREKFGPFTLEGMQSGDKRALSRREVERLFPF
jgi:23S rRNA pseudouridine2605 synthase